METIYNSINITQEKEENNILEKQFFLYILNRINPNHTYKFTKFVFLRQIILFSRFIGMYKTLLT